MLGDEQELPRGLRIAAYTLGTLAFVGVGLPLYVGGFVVILTDWLPVSIGLTRWVWLDVVLWGGIGAMLCAMVVSVVLIPFGLVLWLLMKGRERRSVS